MVPATVSPGEAARMALVGDGCPTFSWGAVPEAASYELMVWTAGAGSEVAGGSARPVVTERLPGTVTSWTPSLDRCLEPGGRYAWVVRAVGAEKSSPWSEARLFSVASGPTRGELEEALAVVRAYLGSGGDEAELAARSEMGSRAREPATSAASHASAAAAVSIGSADATIWAEPASDAPGTVGVAGLSLSVDGAGAVFANKAGGPDLVLDGSLHGAEDTVLTESGIEVGFKTFEIGNAADDLSLTVDGTKVMALACPNGDIAKTSSGEWTCASDADALGNIPDCREGEIPRWDASVTIWKCTPDANTTYTAGNQLTLAGREFNVEDGPGSGLDADTIDSMDSSAFASAAEVATLQVSIDSLHDRLDCPSAAFSSGGRFVDCGNGTIRDMNTGLIWLKENDCLLTADWETAKARARSLNSGECGLTDGSLPGQWRLPEIWEFCSAASPIPTWSIDCPPESANDSLMNTNFSDPALSDASGERQLSYGNPFYFTSGGHYWSATEDSPGNAWYASTINGDVRPTETAWNGAQVWPVRGPE